VIARRDELRSETPNPAPAEPARAAERSRVIDRNIRSLLEHRHALDRQRPAPERVADAVTRFTGSMTFVFIHLAVYGLWIIINLGWIPGAPRFDPTFVVLAMAASVEAIFLSTFVLITQNRMQAQADRRADLDLQIGLLAEHELTRVIKMLDEIQDEMGIENDSDPELQELEKEVHPEDVLAEIDRIKQRLSQSTE